MRRGPLANLCVGTARCSSYVLLDFRLIFCAQSRRNLEYQWYKQCTMITLDLLHIWHSWIWFGMHNLVFFLRLAVSHLSAGFDECKLLPTCYIRYVHCDPMQPRADEWHRACVCISAEPPLRTHSVLVLILQWLSGYEIMRMYSNRSAGQPFHWPFSLKSWASRSRRSRAVGVTNRIFSDCTLQHSATEFVLGHDLP